ncbi:MAG: potassium-transporting ATPase subunit C [Candidatus Acidulodesulfobacterium ferriphilum]|uniref:Potassium-transporting ATPase KdpC subunit n=1 Tax=Candidatus Acidulodesulfobacterium ferriphilum TaxID=2597223 RepID=A0A519BAQ7_9DELT|nr:MAG: potassium-transporting ATPase subunit C [Candidatus Acidulodesulfobacterium ferriphilum]
MLNDFLKSIKLAVWLFILCSVVYTFFIWGIGKIFFPFQAGGSIIYKNSKPIGSLLIGEKFNSPYLFNSRPSSAGIGYQADASSASNYGPTNKDYIDAVKKRIKRFLSENPTVKKGEIPVDLVTGSGSGLDPFISVLGALTQITRISKLTGINRNRLRELVESNISYRDFGIFGTPGVNTVKLNLKLASLLKSVNPKIYDKVFRGLVNTGNKN